MALTLGARAPSQDDPRMLNFSNAVEEHRVLVEQFEQILNQLRKGRNVGTLVIDHAAINAIALRTPPVLIDDCKGRQWPIGTATGAAADMRAR